MQTVAPQTAVHPQCHLRLVPQLPSVSQMLPGQQFFAPGFSTSVLALLTHQQIDVRDVSQVWCVTIATQNGSTDLVGAIFPLPRDAEVSPLDLVGPPRYAMVEDAA